MIIISIINLIIYRKIFFLHKRRGINKKVFYIIKFKTMKHPNQSDYKINKISKFFRNTKLDEIPQFLNLLKGDITLVGPRPLYTEYDKFLSKKHLLRNTVKPGMTGWAQINEKNNITWKEKFDLDVWYVKNKSIRLDLYIIFKTLLLIVLSFFGTKSFSKKMMKYKGK